MPPRTRPAEGDAGHERPERTADGPRGGFGRERLENTFAAGRREGSKERAWLVDKAFPHSDRACQRRPCTSTYHRQPDERYLGLAILGLLEPELRTTSQHWS